MKKIMSALLLAALTTSVAGAATATKKKVAKKKAASAKVVQALPVKEEAPVQAATIPAASSAATSAVSQQAVIPAEQSKVKANLTVSASTAVVTEGDRTVVSTNYGYAGYKMSEATTLGYRQYFSLTNKENAEAKLKEGANLGDGLVVVDNTFDAALIKGSAFLGQGRLLVPMAEGTQSKEIVTAASYMGIAAYELSPSVNFAYILWPSLGFNKDSEKNTAGLRNIAHLGFTPNDSVEMYGEVTIRDSMKSQSNWSSASQEQILTLGTEYSLNKKSKLIAELESASDRLTNLRSDAAEISLTGSFSY